MGQFDSPLGSKKFTGSQLKEFDVPDETGYSQPKRMQPVMPQLDQNSLQEFQNRANISEVEEEIRAAKEARRTGKEKIFEGAKKRLEILLGMTKSVRSVQIETNTFVLQIPKNKEIREAMTEAFKFDGTIQYIFELRRQLLARSLLEISGISFEQFISSNLVEDKLSFIDELSEPLVYRLYNEYNLLVKESQDRYAIKSEQDAEEIRNEVKK